MKTLKSIILSTFGFFAIAGTALTFSSCEQDSCTVLNCKNGGSCQEGLCQCPEGYDGAECEIVLTDRYVGKYIGTNRCNLDGTLFPNMEDTVYINLENKPSDIKMMIKAGNTSLDNFRGRIKDMNTVVFEPLIARDNNGNIIAQIDAFIDFDGHLMNIHLVTLNYLPDGTTNKQSCSFVGKKYVELEE